MATRKVITPGPSLVASARAIAGADPRNAIGTYPYQWLFPGPHSRNVSANNVVALSGPGNTDLILEYIVPDGEIFSCRGFAVGFIGTGWAEGSGTLNWNLTVTAAGTRKVDFLNNIKTHWGSLESPYPILGRLEFAPLSVLRWAVTNAGGPASGTFSFAQLVGHTYPQVEAA